MPNTFNVKLIGIKYLCGHNPLPAKRKTEVLIGRKECCRGWGWNEGAKGCYKVFKHSTIRWRQEGKKERREERKSKRDSGMALCSVCQSPLSK